MSRNDLISKFLRDNPKYGSIVWLPDYNDIDIYMPGNYSEVLSVDDVASQEDRNRLMKLKEELLHAN